MTGNSAGNCHAATATSAMRRPAGNAGETWSRVPNCVDYVSFVRPLPTLDLAPWQRLVADLSRLGQCESDGCGVVRAHGRWGFFLIPPRGFPEIKVCFYPRSSARQRIRRLQLLEACFSACGRCDERG